MTRHAYISDGLGDRIRRFRKERGWTQTELAQRIGCSCRAIVYYEKQAKYPPAPLVAAMAGAFGIDIATFMAPDEPNCLSKSDEPNLFTDPEDRRLWRRFRTLKLLPDSDRQVIFRMLDTMTKAHGVQRTTATG